MVQSTQTPPVGEGEVRESAEGFSDRWAVGRLVRYLYYMALTVPVLYALGLAAQGGVWNYCLATGASYPRFMTWVFLATLFSPLAWCLVYPLVFGLRIRRRLSMVAERCVNCGYDMVGLDTSEGARCCPECGADVRGTGRLSAEASAEAERLSRRVHCVWVRFTALTLLLVMLATLLVGTPVFISQVPPAWVRIMAWFTGTGSNVATLVVGVILTGLMLVYAVLNDRIYRKFLAL